MQGRRARGKREGIMPGRYCHDCGAAVDEHDRFCAQCGTQLHAAAPADTSDQTPGGAEEEASLRRGDPPPRGFAAVPPTDPDAVEPATPGRPPGDTPSSSAASWQ